MVALSPGLLLLVLSGGVCWAWLGFLSQSFRYWPCWGCDPVSFGTGRNWLLMNCLSIQMEGCCAGGKWLQLPPDLGSRLSSGSCRFSGTPGSISCPSLMLLSGAVSEQVPARERWLSAAVAAHTGPRALQRARAVAQRTRAMLRCQQPPNVTDPLTADTQWSLAARDLHHPPRAGGMGVVDCCWVFHGGLS